MTGFSKFATNCERAREWSSLRLDGELPQLQRAMLRKHLAACSGCTAFDSDLADATAALRTAPMELLERPVVIPRRRRSALRIAPAFAAAAAVAFVFGLGPLVQPHLFRSQVLHPLPSYCSSPNNISAPPKLFPSTCGEHAFDLCHEVCRPLRRLTPGSCAVKQQTNHRGVLGLGKLLGHSPQGLASLPDARAN